MKFSRVLRESLRFWPVQIEIADGELQPGGGGIFPALSRAWDFAEECAGSWSEWHQLMVWAIYCALHKRACQAAANSQITVLKSEIDRAYLEHKYSESLLSSKSTYPRHMRRSYLRELAERQRPNEALQWDVSAFGGAAPELGR